MFDIMIIDGRFCDMCKLGDIIVVNKYIGENGKHIGRHSFIVIDNNEDIIRGIEYTHIATVI